MTQTEKNFLYVIKIQLYLNLNFIPHSINDYTTLALWSQTLTCLYNVLCAMFLRYYTEKY